LRDRETKEGRRKQKTEETKKAVDKTQLKKTLFGLSLQVIFFVSACVRNAKSFL